MLVTSFKKTEGPGAAGRWPLAFAPGPALTSITCPRCLAPGLRLAQIALERHGWHVGRKGSVAVDVA